MRIYWIDEESNERVDDMDAQEAADFEAMNDVVAIIAPDGESLTAEELRAVAAAQRYAPTAPRSYYDC